MSPTHREAFAALEWGLLHETSGFTLLVGDSGTGKTTLVKRLLAQHREGLYCICVLNPRLNLDEIMRLVLEELAGIKLPDGSSVSQLNLWRGFEDMIELLDPGERVVILIDDAQDLTDEGLEDVRLLSNIDANGSKRLHFVLVGQPELLTRLRRPALRNINQRIGARATLNPLNRHQAREYVDYRLRQKGGSTARTFTRSALCRLIARSGGIPRQLNMLCNGAMFCAYSEGASIVTLGDARAAVAEYFKPRGSVRAVASRFRSAKVGLRLAKLILSAGIGVALAAAGIHFASAKGSQGLAAQPVRPAPIVVSSAGPVGAHTRRRAERIVAPRRRISYDEARNDLDGAQLDATTADVWVRVRTSPRP